MAVCKKCTEGKHKKCEDVWDSKTKKPRQVEYRGCPCQHKERVVPKESTLPG